MKICDYNPKSRSCNTCKHFDFSTKWDVRGQYEDGDLISLGGCLVHNDQKFMRNCPDWELENECII
jgi:hypothetical protein